MGYWQRESEFGKKVGCFKASLGSLGLKSEGTILPKELSKTSVRKSRTYSELCDLTKKN